MKTFIILFSACIFSQSLFSQTPQPIVLDFHESSKTLSFHDGSSEELLRYRKKNKQEYVFRIDSINTAYHAISINPKVINRSNDIPEILKAIMPGITGAEPVLNGTNQMSTAAVSPLDFLFNEADAQYRALQNTLDTTKGLIKYVQLNWAEVSLCNTKGDETLNYLTSAFGFTSGTKNQKLQKVKDSITTICSDFIVQYEFFNQLVSNLPESVLLDPVFLQKAATFSIQYNNVKANKETLILCVDYIKKVIEAEPFIETKPFKVTGDYASLTTIIAKTAPLSTKAPSDTLVKSTLTFYASHDWDFSFSTGFFFNTLYSRDYYLTSDAVKQIKQEDVLKFDVAIGALGHLSYRFTSRAKTGVALGAALSPLDGKTRYLLGLSYIRGRKNQLAISAGIAAGKLKALSVSDNGTDPRDTLPAGLTSVPTYDKWQIGGFVGITYSLFK